MVNRFAAAQPMGLIRKAILIAVATILLMLAWAAISVQAGGTYYELDPDGMMRPDGTIVQYGPPPSAPRGQPVPPRQTFTYNAKLKPDGSYAITRNGANWITVAQKKGYFAVSDATNSTNQLLIKLDQSAHHGGNATETR